MSTRFFVAFFAALSLLLPLMPAQAMSTLGAHFPVHQAALHVGRSKVKAKATSAVAKKKSQPSPRPSVKAKTNSKKLKHSTARTKASFKPRPSATRTRSTTQTRKTSVKPARSRRRSHAASKPSCSSKVCKFNYPLKTWMWNGPDFDRTPLKPAQGRNVERAFITGDAGRVDPLTLVRAGVFEYYPMRGGISNRLSKVKFVVVHSTETGRPAGAKRVIDSWGNGGLRHPGAQFVVERDGTIFMTVDPAYATSHVDVFKTLYGVTNDNSVGIEIVHTGEQEYTPEQRRSVMYLVVYLQQHYGVDDSHLTTHAHCQPSDRRDPVDFNFPAFLREKRQFLALAAAGKFCDTSATPASPAHKHASHEYCPGTPIPGFRPPTFLRPVH